MGGMEVGEPEGGACAPKSGREFATAVSAAAYATSPGDAVWRGKPERAAPVSGGAACNRELRKRTEKPGSKRRGAVPSAGPREPLRAYQDWCCESGPGPHWWCPATASWACAACEWPCSPTGRAGSDWTREKVPRILNQNALQNLSLKSGRLGGTALRRQCSWQPITPRLPIFPFLWL